VGRADSEPASLPSVAERRPPSRSIRLDGHFGRRRSRLDQRQVVRLPLLGEQIRKARLYFDAAAFMRQLGMCLG